MTNQLPQKPTLFKKCITFEKVITSALKRKKSVIFDKGPVKQFFERKNTIIFLPSNLYIC